MADLTEQQDQQLQPGQHQERTLITPTGSAPGYRIRSVKSLPAGGQRLDAVYDESQNAICVWDGIRWNCWSNGGGADCMFDYLVSSCFTTLPGFTEGKVFSSLSGCTFKGYSTVQGVITDIAAVGANGSEYSVALCGMTTENISVPAMLLGADNIYFYGKGTGAIPGISGIVGVASSATPVISIANGAPTLHFNHVTIQGNTNTNKLVTHAPTNQRTFWTNCHFINSTGNGSVGVDVSSAVAVAFIGCRFDRASILTTGGSGVDGLLVVGCYFISSSIDLSSTQSNSDVVINGNHFDGGDCVINILVFRNCMITGNTFQGNPATTTITLGGGNTSQDLTISGNKFGTGSTTLPYIKFAANFQCRDVSIVGNAFDFTANSNPFIVSANTDCQFVVITGNVFGRTGTGYDITQVVGVSGTFTNSVFGPNAPGQRVKYSITGTENEFYPPTSGSGGAGPFPGAASLDFPFVTIGNVAGLSAERALTAGNGVGFVDGGANASATLNLVPLTADWNQTGVFDILHAGNLKVSKHGAFGAAAAVSSLVILSLSETIASGSARGINVSLTSSAAGTAVVAGLFFGVTGTATVGTQLVLAGVYGSVAWNGAATVSHLVGVMGQGGSSAGTISQFSGLYVPTSTGWTAKPAVTRVLYGEDVNGGVAGVPLAYGLNIAAQTGTAARNYLGNGLVIGSDAALNTNLDVTGNSADLAGGEHRFYNATNTFYVGLKGPNAAANKIWTLPLVDGGASTYLKTDGAGVLSFTAPAAADINTSAMKQTFVLQGWKPTTTAGATASAISERGTTTKHDIQSLAFSSTVDQHAFIHHPMPDNWDGGTVTFRVWWYGKTGYVATTSDGVAWTLKGTSYGDDQVIDSTFGTGVTVTDTGTGNDKLEKTPDSSPLTIAGAGAGKLVHWDISRTTADAADDWAANLELVAVVVEYGISALSS